MALYVQSSGATRYLYGDGGYLTREKAGLALAQMEFNVVEQAKIDLNWSGDEPPGHIEPGGQVITPALSGGWHCSRVDWAKHARCSRTP